MAGLVQQSHTLLRVFGEWGTFRICNLSNFESSRSERTGYCTPELLQRIMEIVDSVGKE